MEQLIHQKTIKQSLREHFRTREVLESSVPGHQPRGITSCTRHSSSAKGRWAVCLHRVQIENMKAAIRSSLEHDILVEETVVLALRCRRYAGPLPRMEDKPIKQWGKAPSWILDSKHWWKWIFDASYLALTSSGMISGTSTSSLVQKELNINLNLKRQQTGSWLKAPKKTMNAATIMLMLKKSNRWKNQVRYQRKDCKTQQKMFEIFKLSRIEKQAQSQDLALTCNHMVNHLSMLNHTNK